MCVCVSGVGPFARLRACPSDTLTPVVYLWKRLGYVEEESITEEGVGTTGVITMAAVTNIFL